MNKRGSGLSTSFVVLAIIAIVILVGSLIFTGRAFSLLPTDCEKSHGECGPPGLDRPTLGAGKGLCENEEEICYIKQSVSGGGSGSIIYTGGIPSDAPKGLILERILYEEPMGATPWVVSLDRAAVYVEPIDSEYITRPQTIREDLEEEKLKPGEVVTFRGYINQDDSMDRCSLSIREVFQGDDFEFEYETLPKNKPVLHRDVRCGRVPIYIHFHPGGSTNYWNKHYEIVLKGKKEGSIQAKQEITYGFWTGNPPEDPKANTFSGGRTNIEELKSGGYIGKPVSFSLENEFGYIEVNDVAIKTPESLDFDVFANIEVDVMDSTIREDLEYNFIWFPASTFGMKGDVNFEIKIPFVKQGDSVRITRFSSDDKDWFGDNSLCRDCKRIQVADGYVFFTAEYDETSGDMFSVALENCKDYSNRFTCAGYSLMSQDVACTWTDPIFTRQDCENCKVEGVRSCSDYNAEFSCIQNSCSLQENCFWNTRTLWRDSCQSCSNANSCNDYESKDSCEANPCGIVSECIWLDDSCAAKHSLGDDFTLA